MEVKDPVKDRRGLNSEMNVNTVSHEEKVALGSNWTESKLCSQRSSEVKSKSMLVNLSQVGKCAPHSVALNI